MLNRRKAIGAMAATLGSICYSNAHAGNQPVPLADAHSHIGLIQKNLRQIDFIEQVKESGLSLISWCVVPDGKWLKSTSSGIVQNGKPAKGQVNQEFKKQLSAIKNHLADINVKQALTASDIDDAGKGETRVVLSSEGSDFVEGDLSNLEDAHKQGLRHTQLVHYIQSELGDLQTIAPNKNGLTEFGADVIKACNRLGLLVDLAHCDAKTLEQALEVSVKPVIWSHGWCSITQGRYDDPFGVLARRLSWDLSKKIAAQNGVVGLWALGVGDKTIDKYPDYPIAFDPQRRYKMYAEGMAHMVKELGADHVCFGTDLEGLGEHGVVNFYRDLRQVANLLSDSGLSDNEIFKVCIGNYSRVLKSAMSV